MSTDVPVVVRLYSLDKPEEESISIKENDSKGMKYTIDVNPSWYLSIALGFQHYLTMFGATVALPLILAGPLCIGEDNLIKSKLICTIFFVSGVATLVQTTVGSRLPIVQGGTYTFLPPTFAILTLPKFACSAAASVNSTANSTATKEWDPKGMLELQGAIAVASLFEVLFGALGFIGFIMNYIGPLTIGPAISLVGLSLVAPAAGFAEKHWGIAIFTIFLIALFSQVLKEIKVPFPGYKRGEGVVKRNVQIFKLFPVILAIILTWMFCAILTVAGALPTDAKSKAYNVRTDVRLDVLKDAPWFRVPYPGQWGLPTISVAAVFGMLAGILGSMIESVGDYYACARLAGAPPPPRHAMNRGILAEGVGCVLAGLIGSGNGTTSYSENIGAIGITQVGSRRVVQYGALIMIVLGALGKFGALFTTIPDPIIGGVFVVTFGMIIGVGISNLQFVSLNTGRNLFVAGFSILIGLVIPYWVTNNPQEIDTGSSEVDQIIKVLLQTNMFVGGVIAFALDNLLPGTDEERGLANWRKQHSHEGESRIASSHVYDLPFGVGNNWQISKYIPFLPYYPIETEPIPTKGVHFEDQQVYNKEQNLGQMNDAVSGSVSMLNANL